MANLKVSIVERYKEDGKWATKSVPIPKQRPGAKGLYSKDDRDGKFLLVWREGSTKKYSEYITTMRDALRAKTQKEQYLRSLAQGLKVEDPTSGKVRLTIADAIDGFLSELTGHGTTVAQYTRNLRQFQKWNAESRTKKTYADQIDHAHIFAFKRWLESEIGNDPFTAVWKCQRVNKMIKGVLHLKPGEGPVKKSDFSEILNRKPTVTTYRKDERDAFLAACEGRSLAVWTLALKCGLRSREIATLEWTDIDSTTHIINIRKKLVKDGNRTIEFVPKKWSLRKVAIPTDVMAMLEKLPHISNIVFPTNTGRIDQKLWEQCKTIAAKAGLDADKFMPKNFRSTYATNRLRSGYTLADLRDQMGHRDMHSVEHYAEAMRSEDLVRSGNVDDGWD